MTHTKETSLLFLHGFPLGPEMWSGQVRFFEAAGYRVVAPDLRLEQAPATMDAMADAAVAAMDAAGVRRAIVAGHSMGGYVAFSLLARYPDRVAGLALVDTRAEPDTEEGKAGRRQTAANALERGTDEVVGTMLGKLLSPRTHELHPEAVKEAERIMRTTSAAAVAAAALGMAERPDRTPMLPGVAVPALVIVGEDDAITPPDIARGMASAMPDAALAIIPEAGHLPNLERPEAFNDAFSDWLGKSVNLAK